MPARLDAAGTHRHLARAARRQRRVVGHQHQRHAAFPGLAEQEVGDLPAGRLVEIAGRLVGDQHQRIGRQRAGNRHALLLAAGQLAGIVGDAVAEPDRLELARGDRERVAMAGEFQRHRDVFQRRHVGDQMEGLEDDADIAAPECGDLVLGLAVERLAGDAHDAGIDPLQAGDHHQQRRLARAGRTDDAGRLATRHLQADAFQHMHQRGAFTQRQRHVVQVQ